MSVPNTPPEKESKSTKDLQSEIEDFGVEEFEVVSDDETPLNINIAQLREDVRGRIAQFFVIGFFLIMLVVVVLSLFTSPGENRTVMDNLKESILTISGVLSGPLGFIIGFYFRKFDEE